MIGINKVILNEETMNQIVENYIRGSMFKGGEFTVSEIDKKSYAKEWTITLEGKEAADAPES